jgi:hypothetical protein
MPGAAGLNVMQLAWRLPPDISNDPSPTIDVGNLVRTGENLYPQYQVIAVSEDRAWVRDIQYGTDQIVPVARCSRIC